MKDVLKVAQEQWRSRFSKDEEVLTIFLQPKEVKKKAYKERTCVILDLLNFQPNNIANVRLK